MDQILTYHYRLKLSKSQSRQLQIWAQSVNQVWNYCNEAAYQQLKKHSAWLSRYDLQLLTKGSSKELGLTAQTIQCICKEYAQQRYQHRKQKLKWRSFQGSRKALGWVPCSNQNIRICDDQVILDSKAFRFWKSRELPGRIKSASLNEDSRGRWFVNLQCEVEPLPQEGQLQLGIDLGLKTQATLSDGRKFERENQTRKYAERLARAQRANKRKQISSIYTKLKNIRKDWSHKTANAILKGAQLIVVGNVSSSKLARTRMAKSVLDSNWYQLKSFLKYKALRLGTIYKEVNESWTSRVCSACGCIGEHKGLSGLSVREWICVECGSLHDRDINAAQNILRLGHQTPIKGDSFVEESVSTVIFVVRSS
jgi:putative transposase